MWVFYEPLKIIWNCLNYFKYNIFNNVLYINGIEICAAYISKTNCENCEKINSINDSKWRKRRIVLSWG